jgi:DNA-3-methyladenine glycosylase
VRLTEVEAYAGEQDPGSHAFRGRTPRTAVMFGEAGHAYVYFTYGCTGASTSSPVRTAPASAVLLRAGEVVDGLDAARERRPGVRDRDLCRGPARPDPRARRHRRARRRRPAVAVVPLRLSGRATPVDSSAVRTGPRVGVAGAGATTPWRFWLDGEPTVSRYRPAVPRRRRTGVVVLQGRVGVVTGAGRGLGREVALALAAEGMHLALLARTGSQVRAVAERIAAEHGLPVLPFAVDVRDAAAVDRVVAHVEQQLGPVDLLVNDAAIIESSQQPFWEVPAQESWDVVETNLRGPFLLCRALLPAMVARRHGHVVNVTSRARAAAETGTYTAYAVSKRALSVLTEALSVALEGTDVVVVDVLPGLVRTPMTDAMPVWRDVPDTQWTPASATARVVVDVAAGRYDDRAGSVLDAAALSAD